jgi:hypothetical protein
MAGFSPEERREFEEGALAFVQEFGKVATHAGAPADATFLRSYTDSLGQLATSRFSDSLQALIEEEPDLGAGFLQSGDGGASIGHFVLKAFQKRLCNPTTEAELKAEIDRVREKHKLEINPTAAGISGGAATAVALAVGTLIGSGPLTIVLAPLAGSVALLLLLVGVDAFCGWASGGQA